MNSSAARLLFIGNSFIFRNDLPALIGQMAPHEIETQNIVAGGASLRLHLNSGAIENALDEAKWDIVVLQEQSTLPIKNTKRFHENVREVQQLIEKTGAQTALYQTWARQNAPETQDTLNRAYETIAEEIGALLIPVGAAWQKALAMPNEGQNEMQNDLPLYDADGSHPAPLGSYLAACVFVSKLWNQDARGLLVPEALKLGASHAATVRDAAWQTSGI